MNDKRKADAIDEFYANFNKQPIVNMLTAKPSEIINWAQNIGEVFENFYNRAYTDGYKDATEIKI